jgi:acetyltransferase-like isoleucine patch superfamily enzyme
MGRELGIYINGIEFGDNVYIAPGVKIISANHDLDKGATLISLKRDLSFLG